MPDLFHETITGNFIVTLIVHAIACNEDDSICRRNWIVNSSTISCPGDETGSANIFSAREFCFQTIKSGQLLAESPEPEVRPREAPLAAASLSTWPDILDEPGAT